MILRRAGDPSRAMVSQFYIGITTIESNWFVAISLVAVSECGHYDLLP